jgi:hypothetical protein
LPFSLCPQAEGLEATAAAKAQEVAAQQAQRDALQAYERALTLLVAACERVLRHSLGWLPALPEVTPEQQEGSPQGAAHRPRRWQEQHQQQAEEELRHRQPQQQRRQPQQRVGEPQQQVGEPQQQEAEESHAKTVRGAKQAVELERMDATRQTAGDAVTPSGTPAGTFAEAAVAVTSDQEQEPPQLQPQPQPAQLQPPPQAQLEGAATASGGASDGHAGCSLEPLAAQVAQWLERYRATLEGLRRARLPRSGRLRPPEPAQAPAVDCVRLMAGCLALPPREVGAAPPLGPFGASPGLPIDVRHAVLVFPAFRPWPVQVLALALSWFFMQPAPPRPAAPRSAASPYLPSLRGRPSIAPTWRPPCPHPSA